MNESAVTFCNIAEPNDAYVEVSSVDICNLNYAEQPALNNQIARSIVAGKFVINIVDNGLPNTKGAEPRVGDRIHATPGGKERGVTTHIDRQN